MTSLEDKARAAKNFSFLVAESNVSGELKLDDMELSTIPSEIWKAGQLIKSISMQRRSSIAWLMAENEVPFVHLS